MRMILTLVFAKCCYNLLSWVERSKLNMLEQRTAAATGASEP